MEKIDTTRLIDIVLSAIFISWVLPLWIIVIPILRFTGEGEVFYRQPRVGKNGKLFNLLKFATMLKNSPNIGTGELTVHNDPRVLPIGRLLRMSKINELPQLINVLIGDMSIVGPRPQTPRCFAAFPKAMQDRIVQVRPGLSGIGSIIFRGEEKLLQRAADPETFYDRIIMPYKGEIEQWYIDRPTMSNYFLVIITTIWIILFPKSKIAWKLFKGLPAPPAELASHL
ncbi:MAG: sugar transferase [Candidatus Contendobacter sp.]|nr:sugar transferase [Candidatus Contendobacter sp.]